MKNDLQKTIQIMGLLLLTAVILLSTVLTACDLNSTTTVLSSSSHDKNSGTGQVSQVSSSIPNTSETDPSEISSSVTHSAETSSSVTSSDFSDESTVETKPVAEWPSDALNGLSAPQGYVSAVITDDQSKTITVIIDEISLEQVKAYHLLLQDNHFQFQEETDEALQYTVSLQSDPVHIQLIYDKTLQQLLMVYHKLTVSEETEPTQSSLPDTDLIWPEEWTELSAPANAKIMEIVYFDERDTIIYLDLVSRTIAVSYVESLGELFTQEAVIQIGDASMMYMGENETGDYIEFFWSEDLSASIELIRSAAPLEE